MANILLNHVYKQYPNNSSKKKDKNPFAVIDFNLEINDGEFVVFVGPSGCGKSTTLRMIAGLEDITSGDLYIDGVFTNNKEPKDRDIAMVFQSYALYPHKTAYGNIAFALKLRKYPFALLDEDGKEVYGIDEGKIKKIENDINKLNKTIARLHKRKIKFNNKKEALSNQKGKDDEIAIIDSLIKQIDDKINTCNKECNKAVNELEYYKTNQVQLFKYRHLTKEEIDVKIKEVAKILDIEQLLDRKPSDMSGGQRQRIALGRAMVRDPKAFLLDEPLSNLDAKLRTTMRSEIVKLHNQIKTTFIYVTHDQIEAMTMGTKIVVMKEGRIMQVACPTDLYDYPKNKFVAGFIGTPQMNFFEVDIQKKLKYLEVTFSDGQKMKLSLDKLRKIKDEYLDGEVHKVYLGVRGEQMKIADSGLKFELSISEVLGTSTNLFIRLPKTDKEYILTVNERTSIKDGEIIKVKFDEKFTHFFDIETEESILVG